MKEIRLLLVFAVLTAFLVGCKRNTVEVREVASFPLEASLVADSVSIPPVALSPFKMFIEPDRLVLFSLGKRPLFDFFSFPDLEYLYSYGDVGNASNEFSLFDSNITHISGSRYKVYQQNKKKIVEISLTEKGVVLADEQDVKIDGMLNGFAFLEKGLFLSFPWQGENAEYVTWNSETLTPKPFGEFPQYENMLTVQDASRIYVRSPYPCPDGSRFVSFYGFFPRFRIYTSDGKLQADVLVTQGSVDKVLPSSIRERKYYATKAVATASRFYVLSNVYESANRVPVIQIWDWEGHPLAQYRLDRDWSCFSVAESVHRIYAVSPSAVDKIFVYSDLYNTSDF